MRRTLSTLISGDIPQESFSSNEAALVREETMDWRIGRALFEFIIPRDDLRGLEVLTDLANTSLAGVGASLIVRRLPNLGQGSRVGWRPYMC
jgi:hypothetical protein